MEIVIGIDFGGTKIMTAAADLNGKILRRLRADTPANFEDGLEYFKSAVRELSAGDTLRAIGMAAGGPLDYQRGEISPLHCPDWRQVPIKSLLEKEFAVPFGVDVDTNLAALAEYEYGGNRCSRLLYLTLSTGLGGGFIIDGEIFRGSAGVHPEVGHQSVPIKLTKPVEIVCACGAPNCLEAVVSGTAIRKIYGKEARDLSGDEWAEVGYNLGQGLRNLAVIYAPDLIVLGGGAAIGGAEPLLAACRAVLEKEVRIIPAPEITISSLGYDSTLYGAITLALGLKGIQ